MREVEADADQPERDPENDDERRAALRSTRASALQNFGPWTLDFRLHQAPPEFVLWVVFVWLTERTGTTNSYGCTCRKSTLLSPLTEIRIFTANGRFVSPMLVSQLSRQFWPS